MQPPRIIPLLSTLLTLSALAATTSTHAASLAQAAKALSAQEAKTLSYSATGRWFQFGQAPAPGLPWPQFDVSSYEAAFDFEQGAAHVLQTRKQINDPKRARPTPTEQKPDQYLLADKAWNLAAPTGGAVGAPAVASAQPAQVSERQAELLATPQGFIRAALANQAKVKPGKGGAEVSFTVDGKYRYVGQLDRHNHLTKVQTWIDNPVLGDTLVETRYSDYHDFAGLVFPKHIVRLQGGHPVLDLQVANVKLNETLAITVPPELANTALASALPAISVTATTLAPGVIHLTGGTHNSVAIEQKDHVVVVEAPLNEARSLAVIAKVKELFPGKPLTHLINSHAHFDHSGGLRTWVAQGATIVTAKANRDYYQKVWAAPHSINPDLLAQHKKAAKFDTFTGKHVLSDGQRQIEIYPISGNTHNDAFALVYLPAEKILIEADAYNPTPANVSPPATPNPYSVNLYENIEKLKLDVQTIAGLHGTKAVTLADLRTAIGQTVSQAGSLPAQQTADAGQVVGK
jgi:glyoxylase-like metal-dependent hydrolase (beta-lactamase superfamily II)